VPAIISADLWDRAQKAIRAQTGDRTRNNKANYLLRGLATCPRCGLKLYPSWQRRNGSNKEAPKVRTYRCGSFSRVSGWCGALPVNAEKLEQWAWERVMQVLRHPEVIAAELERERAEGPDPPHSAADPVGLALPGQEGKPGSPVLAAT
jgi:Recombinase zinc beta ribbon domain